MRTARRLSRAKWIPACVAAAIVVGCAGGTGPAEKAATPRVPSGKVELASEAYVFSYPLVLFDRMRRAQAESVGAYNQLVVRSTTGTPFTQSGVRADADTVSATAFLDLHSGPIVLSVPDSGDRFTRIELLDAYTNVFASLGKRTNGNHAASWAIVGPGSSGSVAGVTETVHAPTNFALLQAQLVTEGERDVAAASGLMRQWSLTPLGAFAQGKRVAAIAHPRSAAGPDSPVSRVEALTAAKFAEEATKLLAQNPPSAADAPLAKKFASVGLDYKRGSFDSSKLDSGSADAAWSDARQRIRGAQPAGGRAADGWDFSPASGSFGVDYLSRAAAARRGVGGSMLAEDEIEATARVDAGGQRLSGAHRYELSFKKAPPVNALWTLTLVDDQGRMVDNVLNRYSVRGDRIGKSAKVLVQFAPPSGRPPNWLPAPNGSFALVLRLYWPKADAVSGAWSPPAVKRVD